MPKSSVHVLGRNRKHRPNRKAPFHASAANVNMKGKKEKLMSCWCCVCIYFREHELKKQHEKEMGEG